MATRDEVIAEELSVDPLARNYIGMDNPTAAADMNTEYRTLEQGVWLSDAYQYLSHRNNDPGTGRALPCLVMLQECAENATVDGQVVADDFQLAAKNLMGFIAKSTDAGGELIWMDFSQGAIRQSWDAMVTIGVIDQNQRDTLGTLSNVPQSRGNELKYQDANGRDMSVGEVTAYDVERNRA